MSNAGTNSRQFSLATLIGAMLFCSIFFAIVAGMETKYDITYACASMPEDDTELETWFGEQDDVSNPIVSRDANEVHIQYTKREVISSFEMPMPPVSDLGYDITGVKTKISSPSLLSATLNWVARSRYLVWLVTAIVIGALFYTWMRSRSEPNAATSTTDTDSAA